MVRKIVVAACATLFALTATACNTVRGAGADIEDASSDVDEAI